MDVWALGCLFYALMYREGPFDWQVDQNSIALAVMSGRVRWPNDPNTHYPAPLHELVHFMLQVGSLGRPRFKPSVSPFTEMADQALGALGGAESHRRTG